MIVRVWNARAIAPKVLQYLARFHDAVLPQLKTLSGFMGATVMQREISVGELEIVVQTRWQSMLAVRSFAGDPPDLAVVEKAAVAVLNDYGRVVRHFDIELEAGPE